MFRECRSAGARRPPESLPGVLCIRLVTNREPALSRWCPCAASPVSFPPCGIFWGAAGSSRHRGLQGGRGLGQRGCALHGWLLVHSFQLVPGSASMPGQVHRVGARGSRGPSGLPSLTVVAVRCPMPSPVHRAIIRHTLGSLVAFGVL